jgi:diguanylate cyclase (GGDEF)-like protein
VLNAILPADEAIRSEAVEAEKITDTPREETFDRIVRLACAAMSTPIGVVTIVEGDRQWFKAHEGLDIIETPREHSFCAHAILGDEVMVIEDATKDQRFYDNPLVTAVDGIRFYAGAPLRSSSGHKLGTLCVVDHIPRRIGQRERRLLKDLAAIVVDELELRKRAGTDPLTGLYTRRFMEELATRELARARRSSQPLTVAFIDADKFKSINDEFGHVAGDVVLRSIALSCREALRTQDLLCRYGGEELVLLLPGISLDGAMPVLERLRKAVESLDLSVLNGRGVSVSVGAAELISSDVGVSDVLKRADEALYAAKRSGRNRVELARVA